MVTMTCLVMLGRISVTSHALLPSFLPPRKHCFLSFNCNREEKVVTGNIDAAANSYKHEVRIERREKRQRRYKERKRDEERQKTNYNRQLGALNRVDRGLVFFF